ncbi:MAG TPA: FtsX-like permease family protein [Steroidobacteraceae bacterium]|nr:FtsX-like permease family protein [Steroidobacteraceae bacterium]
MRLLWAASLRHCRRRPAQLVLALTGLALGVATVVAVDIATGSAARAFELSMQAVSGPATHELTAGPNGVDETLYVRLARQLHVIALAPVVEGYVTAGGEALQLLGVDALAEDAGADSQLRGARVAGAPAGAAPGPLGLLRAFVASPGTVVMAADTARRLQLVPGAAFTLDADGRGLRARLLAILPQAPGGGTLLLTDIAQAQEWLGLPGRLSRIDLTVPASPAGAAELGRLRALLPPGVQLAPTGTQARANLELTQAFTTNLDALGGLALLVGLFLVYGAMSFAVVQRRALLGVLRALGATRAQILALILGEAAVLAAGGALLGLAAGALIARALVALVSRTINDLYFVVAVNSVALPPRELLAAFAAACLVALAAAALPALEAARAAPALALRRSVAEGCAVRRAGRLAGAGLALGLLSALLLAGSHRSVTAGFAALFALLLAVAAVTPALLRLAALRLARAAAHTVPRLALTGVAASLSRTGVAVAALAMAVTAMIGITIMVDSFRGSLTQWLEQTLQADVYVGAPGPGFGAPERRLDPEVIAALRRVPGVAQASAARHAVVGSPRGPQAVDAVEFLPRMQDALQLESGDPRTLRQALLAGAVLAAAPLAYRLHLGMGGSIRLITAHGAHDFPVAGIYREYGNDRGSLRMDLALYRRWWNDEGVSSLALFLAPGRSPAQVIPQLYRAAAGRQALLVSAGAEVRALSLAIFERTFVITRVLDYLAAGVATIGLISALSAWQLERAGELALLRALGLSRRGTALLVETQAGIMGLAALLAAIPAGALTAVLLVRVINHRAFGWQIDLHLAPAQFGAAAVLALTAALAAGLYPAWSSTRALPAAALREE